MSDRDTDVAAVTTPPGSLIQALPRWIALVASVAVAGYAGSAIASRSAHTDWGNRPEPYTMTYLGHPLHCLVVEDGAVAGRIGGLSCDFARYWRSR